MKVAFDEHVPPLIVKVFLSLIKEKRVKKTIEGLTFERASDYAPKRGDPDYRKGSDVGWLNRYAASGGHAIISGDVKMRKNPHELFALYENDFVVVFFEDRWSEWDFFQKSALMLHWWEKIVEKIKIADNGTFWVVPCNWPVKNDPPKTKNNNNLRNVSFGLSKLLKDNPNKVNKRRTPKIRKRATKNDNGDRQTAFMDKLVGNHDENDQS